MMVAILWASRLLKDQRIKVPSDLFVKVARCHCGFQGRGGPDQFRQLGLGSRIRIQQIRVYYRYLLVSQR